MDGGRAFLYYLDRVCICIFLYLSEDLNIGTTKSARVNMDLGKFGDRRPELEGREGDLCGGGRGRLPVGSRWGGEDFQ